MLSALSGHVTLPCCRRLFAHLNNDSEGFLSFPRLHTLCEWLLKSFPIIFLGF